MITRVTTDCVDYYQDDENGNFEIMLESKHDHIMLNVVTPADRLAEKRDRPIDGQLRRN